MSGRLPVRMVVRRTGPGRIQRIDADGGLFGERHTDREMFQHYGYASRPLDGSESIFLFLGGNVNNAVSIAEEDGRYRPELRNGEVVLYTDEGDVIHFKRGNQINVASLKKVRVESGDVVEVEAATGIKLKAPNIDFYGTPTFHAYDGGADCEATIDGNLHATGDISDSVRTISSDRVIYNSHRHADAQGGNTGVPTILE